MLIHPAMMAHPTGAKRVAILGGGEGATLREALKYKSVTEVVMIELDPDVIRIAKRELKQLNNCTYHTGPHYTSCFDDPRATILETDAIQWFDDTFKDIPCTEAEGAKREDKFDVIVMDLLDPEAAPDAPFAKLLYSPATLKRLVCALNDDGVLIAQIGEAPTSNPVPEKLFSFKLDILQKFAKHMQSGGTFVYDVYVPTFQGNWGFFLGCKSAICAQRFMDNSARVNLGVRQRLLPQAFPLSYYDGAVHHNIQMTPKAWEEAYCTHAHADGRYCDWRYRASAEDGLTEGRPEAWMERAAAVREGRRQNQVVATKDIRKNEKLGLYDAATSLKISHRDLDQVRNFAATHDSTDYKMLVRWLDRYGYACNVEGGQYYVSLLSMLTFVNHGCEGDAGSGPNIDGHYGVDGGGADDGDDKAAGSGSVWDPIQMRYAREHCAETRATRAIKKGEVFLEDYRSFDGAEGGDKNVTKKELADTWCGGKKA